ncbi:MAG: hypothetical protein Q4C96_04340 [Planctomycetia bacterium]|nr:hypothetical protein [Planctomycetia bacterium]
MLLFAEVNHPFPYVLVFCGLLLIVFFMGAGVYIHGLKNMVITGLLMIPIVIFTTMTTAAFYAFYSLFAFALGVALETNVPPMSLEACFITWFIVLIITCVSNWRIFPHK